MVAPEDAQPHVRQQVGLPAGDDHEIGADVAAFVEDAADLGLGELAVLRVEPRIAAGAKQVAAHGRTDHNEHGTHTDLSLSASRLREPTIPQL